MTTEYNNFIGIYHDVYPDGYCQHLINEFERLSKNGVGWYRQQREKVSKHEKNDYSIIFNFKSHDTFHFKNNDVVDIFFAGLQECYDHYTTEFSILKNSKINGSTMKVQRTDPGGGYHLWHGEQGNNRHAQRVLVYSLYLNTLEPEEAGETEFLYQQQRFRPIENTMIIWPAAFTHAHRGNTVFGERSKYIVTGWFYYE